MGIVAEMYKSQGRVGRTRLVEQYDESGVYYVREKVYARPRVTKPAAPRRTKAKTRSGRRARARHTSASSSAASGDGDGDGDPARPRTRRSTCTPTPPSLPPASRRVLRIQDVMHITGLARPTVYKLIKSGDFPAPIKLGSAAAGWLAHEIDAWLDACIAARDTEVQS